jgi:hypothetical protein
MIGMLECKNVDQEVECGVCNKVHAILLLVVSEVIFVYNHTKYNFYLISKINNFIR